MSERKVLNKYYPPNFDPTKIPKLNYARNRQYSIRIMAPFNMRCNTCGEYIYKGKKFNSKKETVENEFYLGLYIFRFYIKCPGCVSEIAFKTDPEKTDYELEAGATRNFEALRTAEEMAVREQKEKEEDEKNNPMKVLENRTKASRNEMDMIETLEELRDLNSRHARVDTEGMLRLQGAYEEQLRKLQDQEDENFIQSVFGNTSKDDGAIKRIHEDDEDEDGPRLKVAKTDKPTDILSKPLEKVTEKRKPTAWDRSVGSISGKSKLSMLVRKRPTGKSNIPTDKEPSVLNKGLVVPTNIEKPKPDKAEDNSGANVCARQIASASSADTVTAKTSAPSSALGLLGNYSDSDSQESD